MEEATGTGAPRWNIAPYFHVSDVAAAADFYRDKLGFQYDQFWGDPPAFCMVYRSGVTIMLAQSCLPEAVRPNAGADPEESAWDAYIWIDNADALAKEYRSKGVNFVRDVCDQPYGCRDFEVLDNNGYRLCFGHDVARGDSTG